MYNRGDRMKLGGLAVGIVVLAIAAVTVFDDDAATTAPQTAVEPEAAAATPGDQPVVAAAAAGDREAELVAAADAMWAAMADGDADGVREYLSEACNALLTDDLMSLAISMAESLGDQTATATVSGDTGQVTWVNTGDVETWVLTDGRWAQNDCGA